MITSTGGFLLILNSFQLKVLMFWNEEEITFDKVDHCGAFLLSLLLSCLFVGSLYVWPEKYNRDHPTTIKRRFIRITIASMMSCVVVYASSSPVTAQEKGKLRSATALEWIGVRCSNLMMASFLPVLLLALLFLGPLFNLLIDGSVKSYIAFDFRSIKFWRNYFVAPLAEEFVFRGCMIPILYPSFGNWSILLGPLFFGTAHIHHAYEQYSSGHYSRAEILLTTLFQTFYTTVFGVLSSFIFIRTHHLASPTFAHAFCNVMGFPEFENVAHHRHGWLIGLFYCLGLVLFACALFPLTEPSLYGSHLFA